MKTPQDILDELAKEKHFEDWASLRISSVDDDTIIEAMEKYAMQYHEQHLPCQHEEMMGSTCIKCGYDSTGNYN